MDIKDLIHLMSDGEYHSGEEMGERLAVSRTAVWKQLKKLEEQGIPLESVKGVGYRVPGGLELLNAQRINALLAASSAALLHDLTVLDAVDSTNNWVKTLVEKESINRRVCLAERQTAGRGRRGRHWISPYGRNIYLSLAWDYSGGAAALGGLSLAVGVAVRRALAACGVADICLKWPNDLMRNGKKLAGILVEMTGDPTDICQAIVGVGVNLHMSESAAVAIDQPWSDLSDIENLSRNRLAAAIISELVSVLANYQKTGFMAYREEWERYDGFRGAAVRLSTENSRVEGIACGVAENGAVKIKVDGQVQTFSGGEFSLRVRGPEEK